jgi:hypothetical protein
LWTLSGSRLWEEGVVSIELADGEQWPDPTLIGPFYAKYEDAEISIPDIPLRPILYGKII